MILQAVCSAFVPLYDPPILSRMRDVMQSEWLLDLEGGAGEKPTRPDEQSGRCWDDVEYEPEELKWFAAASVQEIADHYYWLLDVDPLAGNRRASQLRQVMADRGITMQALRNTRCN